MDKINYCNIKKELIFYQSLENFLIIKLMDQIQLRLLESILQKLQMNI